MELIAFLDSVFAERASSERKLWGFNLLAWAIGSAPSDLLSALFTPNFTRSLINQRFGQERDLFIVANQPLEAIVSRAEKDPDSALKLLDILITSDTSVHFDRVTKSSTLSRLVSNVPDETKSTLIGAISEYIQEPPLEDKSDAGEASKARIVLANLLVAMAARAASSRIPLMQLGPRN
jgi:DNA polymerase phi